MPKATTSDERLIGRVKWFNNKAGYGFVTVTDGAQAGSDIFVHHSAIGVSTQQYKYLVQGEYVEFSITQTQSGTHPFQASNICGINGGKLMCETRNETKIARNNYKTSGDSTTHEPVKMPRQQKAPKPQAKPQAKDEDQKDWTLIKGNKTSQPRDTEKSTTRGTSTGGRGTGRGSGRGSSRGGRGGRL